MTNIEIDYNQFKYLAMGANGIWKLFSKRPAQGYDDWESEHYELANMNQHGHINLEKYLCPNGWSKSIHMYSKISQKFIGYAEMTKEEEKIFIFESDLSKCNKKLKSLNRKKEEIDIEIERVTDEIIQIVSDLKKLENSVEPFVRIVEQKLMDISAETGLSEMAHHKYITTKINETKYVLSILLPNANDEWTSAVFTTALKLVNEIKNSKYIVGNSIYIDNAFNLPYVTDKYLHIQINKCL